MTAPHRITNLDVARHAGVSPTTVSMVLNDRRDISIAESTRLRVREAAAELKYRPNTLARSLVRGRTQTIGLVMPRLDSSFCGCVAQGIQEACLAADFRVLVANTLHQVEVEARQVDLLLDHQVDGVISLTEEATVQELPRWLSRALSEQVPCVLVDTRSFSKRVDCVVSDDISGARLAVEHLISLGHTRIAHLRGGLATTTAEDRLEGYRQALDAVGLRAEKKWVFGASYYVTEMDAQLDALLAMPKPPTAVFAGNDELAALFMRAVSRRGKRVPEDMAIVGYANYAFSEYMELTTIHQDAIEMGRLAATRLLDRIAKPDLKPQLILSPTRLVIRRSCGFNPKTITNQTR